MLIRIGRSRSRQYPLARPFLIQTVEIPAQSVQSLVCIGNNRLLGVWKDSPGANFQSKQDGWIPIRTLVVS